MNQRDQAAAFDARYGSALERLVRIVREFLDLGLEIRFTLPPKDVFVIAALSDVGERVARSWAAREIIRRACAIRPEEMPTLGMLAAVLDSCGIEADRVSLAELGIHGSAKEAS